MHFDVTIWNYFLSVIFWLLIASVYPAPLGDILNSVESFIVCFLAFQRLLSIFLKALSA